MGQEPKTRKSDESPPTSEISLALSDRIPHASTVYPQTGTENNLWQTDTQGISGLPWTPSTTSVVYGRGGHCLLMRPFSGFCTAQQKRLRDNEVSSRFRGWCESSRVAFFAVAGKCMPLTRSDQLDSPLGFHAEQQTKYCTYALHSQPYENNFTKSKDVNHTIVEN